MLILNRHLHYALGKLGVDLDEEGRYIVAGDIVSCGESYAVGFGCKVYIAGRLFNLIPLLEGGLI